MITARWYRALAGAAAMALVLASPAAHAQTNQLKQVEANVVGEQTVFTVDLQGPLTQKPADFTTQNPAKIAIDFFDTGFPAGRAQYEYAGKVLKSANVMQIGDRTRVVLNLSRSATYRTEVRGNQFVVLLDNVTQTGTTAAPTFAASPAPAQAANRAALRNIDFRRGTDGAGRVVVDLSSRDSGINIQQQGQNLVVDFMGTALPQDLRRRFDVTDFGTPVQGMRASDANRAVTGSTARTRPTTSSWLKCVRSRTIRTS
jgi:type IV pilus assembly protein PilQ